MATAKAAATKEPPLSFDPENDTIESLHDKIQRLKEQRGEAWRRVLYPDANEGTTHEARKHVIIADNHPDVRAIDTQIGLLRLEQMEMIRQRDAEQSERDAAVNAEEGGE